MVRNIGRDAGLSLVEATIILGVLSVLTGVFSPSVVDFLNDAKDVKVKEDCEAIGTSVARLVRDVGACLKRRGDEPCTMGNRVDLLVSGGPDIQAGDVHGATCADGAAVTLPYNWDNDAGPNSDTMENQFVTNEPRYATPDDLQTYDVAGPHMMLGWRGAYLAAPIGPDPWGRRYVVNSAFLAVATVLDGERRPAASRRGWSHNVFCLSAGRNRFYETPIAAQRGSGVVRTGDDFIYVIGGSTR